MSRFSELFADVALPALQDALGEEITYAPAGGAERTITAVCILGDNVAATEKERKLVERLVVKAGRDPDASGGGIATPKIGDAVVRDGKRYAFSGEILPGDQGAVALVFTRPRPKVAGGAQHQ